MEGQENICGVAIETECPSIEIQEIPAIDFQLWFIDKLASLLQSSIKPKITVTLFEPQENTGKQVTIIPTEINNLHQVTTSRTFQIALRLFDNDAVTLNAYSNILSMVKIIVNAVNVLSKRQNLTYLPRFVIINSGEANLFLTVTKTL